MQFVSIRMFLKIRHFKVKIVCLLIYFQEIIMLEIRRKIRACGRRLLQQLEKLSSSDITIYRTSIGNFASFTKIFVLFVLFILLQSTFRCIDQRPYCNSSIVFRISHRYKHSFDRSTVSVGLDAIDNTSA